ncbi:hypothetical protein GQ44DRAFT_709185 [Phaeosphaeriaceae sp. PMI808]|nr:hypothetical protein GQ44DRAFT_709185 [Phaeosphaeriaceae sp. PMI808]
MQAQYPQYQTIPTQHGMVGTTAGGIHGQPPPPQVEMPGPFSHLLQFPVFQIYSLKEFKIIRQRIEENLKTKQLHQEVLNNMPPPPTTADAITAKVVMEYLSIMSDGGVTFVANRFSIDKFMSGTLGKCVVHPSSSTFSHGTRSLIAPICLVSK